MMPADPTPALDPNAANGPPAAPPDPLAAPTFEECIEEAVRYNDGRRDGRIDLKGIPEGHYVAYYAGRIHDHDADGHALRHRVAAALGIHSERVYIHYPWMW